MMTREDMMRELELLPVWKLRAPLNVAEPIAENAPIAPAEVSCELIISEDKKWCFISQNGLPADRMDIGPQGVLFKNILHALKINKTHKILLENISEAKVIIAMGEIAAQQLLKTTESLEQLRGKMHIYQNIPLIATYHPNDILQHLQNKAKTWDDLCLAISILNA